MALKWAFAVAAVVAVFFTAGIAGALLAEVNGFWYLPGGGFCAAISVVVVSYLAAPRGKFLFAACTFALGAIVAWLILEPSFYPDSYGSHDAYEPTHLPLLATVIGGISGLVFAGLLKVRSRHGA